MSRSNSVNTSSASCNEGRSAIPSRNSANTVPPRPAVQSGVKITPISKRGRVLIGHEILLLLTSGPVYGWRRSFLIDVILIDFPHWWRSTPAIKTKAPRSKECLLADKTRADPNTNISARPGSKASRGPYETFPEVSQRSYRALGSSKQTLQARTTH
ncbi:hypothetical protein E2C01_015306 [Portunus trituberculatus]|uniref:Uncharacterized protein n=1 Tax=Portunus trituberculatus TaxID=210409 RepID=A0A5B7DM83_PORTR|nr:hypothetical protein [Portunus trituberculatus]